MLAVPVSVPSGAHLSRFCRWGNGGQRSHPRLTTAGAGVLGTARPGWLWGPTPVKPQGRETGKVARRLQWPSAPGPSTFVTPLLDEPDWPVGSRVQRTSDTGHQKPGASMLVFGSLDLGGSHHAMRPLSSLWGGSHGRSGVLATAALTHELPWKWVFFPVEPSGDTR